MPANITAAGGITTVVIASTRNPQFVAKGAAPAAPFPRHELLNPQLRHSLRTIAKSRRRLANCGSVELARASCAWCSGGMLVPLSNETSTQLSDLGAMK